MSFMRTTFGLAKTLFVQQGHARTLQLESRRFAGHSHWQNVRHIKAAKDANKAQQTEKFVRLIEVAVTTAGGPDPKLNRTLAHAIENAKRTQVVTNAAIEAAIKRAVNGPQAKNTKSLVYEFVGEHGVLIVANCEVSNTSKFIHGLKAICKKNKFTMPRGGVKERFEEKGFVCIDGRKEDKKVEADEALAVALEGGAEDVTEIGEGSNNMFEFICAPRDYFAMLKVLQTAGYVISDAGTKYIPMMTVSIDDEKKLDHVSNFCDLLEELPEVIGVHTNIA